MIRDSFINGLTSNYIRQRLLENEKLTLDQAHERARTLDLAQKNSEAYSQQSDPLTVAAVTVDQKKAENNTQLLAALRKRANTKPTNPRKKLRYFCGGSMHASRSLCPAREATCHKCSKIGHFLKVCQSLKKESNLSAIHSPTLCAVSTACPPNLRHASVPVIVNNQTLDTLLDSCSSDSFISGAFNRLQLTKTPSNKTVSLALTSLESKVVGSCQLNLSINDRNYENIKVDILQDLCSDLILGYDLQKQHQNLTFQFGGPKPDLLVSPPTETNISAMCESTNTCTKFADVKLPSLFKNLFSQRGRLT